jgi:N-acetylneuraminic acid mutarotase
MYALKTVEAMDTITWTWKGKAPLRTVRWAPSVASWNNKLYAFGGFSERTYSITSIEEYDPAADAWNDLSRPMPFARAYAASCVIGNNLYLVGGQAYDPSVPGIVCVKSIDIFNLSTGTWSKGPNMRNSRANHQCVVWNQRVYIFGGIGGTGDSVAIGDTRTLPSIEVFNPGAGTCDSVAVLSAPRHSFGCDILNGTAYLFGGIDTVDRIISSVETFDCATRQSSNALDIPDARCSAPAVAWRQRFYFIGGARTILDATRSVKVYYP